MYTYTFILIGGIYAMKMLIGGQFCDAINGKSKIVFNPSTGEKIDSIPSAELNDVEQALKFASQGDRKSVV
jgi:acyl-CoA reductase-like NAD-dependent aldehyde dehydrogenase